MASSYQGPYSAEQVRREQLQQVAAEKAAKSAPSKQASDYKPKHSK